MRFERVTTIARNCDWLIALSAPVVIGRSKFVLVLNNILQMYTVVIRVNKLTFFLR